MKDSTKDPRVERGRLAEDVAARWLEEHDWKVLARNVRRPFGELDLVVLKGPTVGFVEVRSHTGDYLDWATDSINVEKQDKVRRMASWYLDTHPNVGAEAIFIAVGVKLDGAGHVTVEEVVEDAF